MKKIVNLFAFVGLIAVLITYSSCGSKAPDAVPLVDQQLQKLLVTTSTTGTVEKDWLCTSATLDGVDKTANYTKDFTLNLKGTLGVDSTGTATTFSYKTSKPTFLTTEGAISPWAIGGTFKFDDKEPAIKVTRDDGTAIQYSVNETTLSISFSFSPADSKTYDRTGGRTEVVKGAWVFTFKPKPL